MSANKDLLVVSAFGRGNWLAAELVGKGFSVTLLDVTDHLGRWGPEDWEGPFGFFKADDLVVSQLSRLSEEDYQDEVAEGFSIWTKEGPFDLRGHLLSYWLEVDPGMHLTKQYLQSFAAAAKDKVEDLEEDLLREGFARNWLAQLAHQLASPVFAPNALALHFGEPLPLLSPFAVRRTTRKGLAKSLDWCEGLGVEVIRGVKIVDVAAEGRQCVGVEIGGAIARVMQAENYVWTLASSETQFMAPKATNVLFPKGILNAEWCWMRWRIQGELGIYRETVPAHFVLIDDLGLPWTHGNLLVVQRSEVQNRFDVWARLPAHHRFQRAYCENFGEEIVARLNRRIPNFKAQVQEQSQDYHYDMGELGPSLFPVFDPEAKSAWSPRTFINLDYDGVEWVKNLDWTGRFARQSEIVTKLVKWKQAQIARLEKGGERDRSVRAP